MCCGWFISRRILSSCLCYYSPKQFTGSNKSRSSVPPGKTKIYCAKCQKKCSGEVLRVTDKYFHKTCFQCAKCSKSLAAGGFFAKDSIYYCVADYQKLFGTKCAVCQLYVEGEVVSTMGNTYHQKCFTCTKCNLPFESGSKVSL